MELVEHSFYYDWEIVLMRWLQAHLGSFGTALANFFTMFGEELACVTVIGLLYWCLDKELGRTIGLTALFGMTVNPMIKNIVLRPRPYIADGSIKCLRPVHPDADIYDLSAQGYSFPSGHATDTITLYGATALRGKNRLLYILGIVIPLFCGISRVCLGVHYPTDVLCGWLLGLCIVFVTNLIDGKTRDKRVYYALLISASLPGWFFCRSDDYYTCFGILVGFILAQIFEQHFVDFKNTRAPIRCVLRLLGGIAIFFGFNSLLKLPFNKNFLKSGTLSAHIVRAARYCLTIFIDIGIYPLVFGPVDRLLDRAKPKNAIEE